EIGQIVVWFPLDDRFLAELRTAAGLTRTDQVLLARNGEVLTGPGGTVGATIAPLPAPRYVSLGGGRYRAVSAVIMPSNPPLRLGGVLPTAPLHDPRSHLTQA